METKMINENNKIVKSMLLGWSDDYSETHVKKVTQNGEIWYTTTVTDSAGLGMFKPSSTTQPYIAIKNPNAKWVAAPLFEMIGEEV